MDLKEIGRVVYQKRKEMGYSKETFSAIANISPRTLYKIENNLSKGVRFETIKHILNLIGFELKVQKKSSS